MGWGGVGSNANREASMTTRMHSHPPFPPHTAVARLCVTPESCSTREYGCICTCRCISIPVKRIRQTRRCSSRGIVDINSNIDVNARVDLEVGIDHDTLSLVLLVVVEVMMPLVVVLDIDLGVNIKM